jgi:hypothetical protein
MYVSECQYKISHDPVSPPNQNLTVDSVWLVAYCTKGNILTEVVEYNCLRVICKLFGHSGSRDGSCTQAAPIQIGSGHYNTLYALQLQLLYSSDSGISHSE